MVMARRTPSSSTTCCGLRRRKIALLVEHVVERQQPLVLLQQQSAAVQQHRGVHGRLAASAGAGSATPASTAVGKSARGRGQLIHGRPAARQKARLLKKIGGRISADGKLGENGQPRAQRGGAAAGRDDFFKIPGEIPDGRIDLGQCDLHSSV